MVKIMHPIFSNIPVKYETQPVIFHKEFALLYTDLSKYDDSAANDIHGNKMNPIDKIGIWIDCVYKKTQNPSQMLICITHIECAECTTDYISDDAAISELEFSDIIDLKQSQWEAIIERMLLRVPIDIQKILGIKSLIPTKLKMRTVKTDYPSFVLAWNKFVR